MPYLNKVKIQQGMTAPLMKSSIKQGKFSRIFMRTAKKPSEIEQSPKYSTRNYNVDIPYLPASTPRRTSDITFK
jgi:hypothetical protein